MATFAEIKTELDTTKKELEALKEKHSGALLSLSELEACRTTQADRIEHLETILNARNFEISALRDELKKSIFIARTPAAKDAEDAMQYTVEAVAHLMGQKKPREPTEGEQALADIIKANNRMNGKSKSKLKKIPPPISPSDLHLELQTSLMMLCLPWEENRSKEFMRALLRKLHVPPTVYGPLNLRGRVTYVANLLEEHPEWELTRAIRTVENRDQLYKIEELVELHPSSLRASSPST